MTVNGIGRKGLIGLFFVYNTISLEDGYLGFSEWRTWNGTAELEMLHSIVLPQHGECASIIAAIT